MIWIRYVCLFSWAGVCWAIWQTVYGAVVVGSAAKSGCCDDVVAVVIARNVSAGRGGEGGAVVVELIFGVNPIVIVRSPKGHGRDQLGRGTVWTRFNLRRA